MKEVLNSVLQYLIDTRELHEIVDKQRQAYDKRDITTELTLRLEEDVVRGRLISLEGLKGLKDTLNKED